MILSKYFSWSKLLAIPISLLIWALLPIDHSRYQLSVESSSVLPKYNKVFYYELDDNQYSNTIITNFKYRRPTVVVNDHLNQVVCQWTLSGNWIEKGMQLMFGDYNQNGKAEIYAFTQSNDSIFLNAFEPYAENGLNLQTVFIDHGMSYRNDQDFNFLPGKVTDLNGDDFKEVVFALNAGFTKQPRNVYAFDIRNNVVLKSPKSGAFITGIRLHDIDHDDRDEILIDNYGPDNIDEPDFPYRDNKAWLMALDNDLSFLFEPKPFDYPFSTAITWPYFTNDSTYLISSLNHYGTIDAVPEMWITRIDGTIIKMTQLEKLPSKNNFVITEEDQSRIFQFHRNGLIQEFNPNLELLKQSKIMPTSERVKLVDLNNDGIKEFVGINSQDKKIVVVPKDLSIIVEEVIGMGVDNHFYYSAKKSKDEAASMALQIGSHHHVLTYKRNPIWLIGYLVYIPIYLTMIIVLPKILSTFKNKKRTSEPANELNPSSAQKLRINTRTGFLLIDFKEILYCEADGNYTKIHLGNGTSEISTRNLGKIEPLLPADSFRRINRSVILNTLFLYKVDRKKKVCYLHYQGNFIQIPLSDKTIKDLGAID